MQKFTNSDFNTVEEMKEFILESDDEDSGWYVDYIIESNKVVEYEIKKSITININGVGY